MSADTKGKKRKSGDSADPAAKKIKTVKSDGPAPLKSALKNPKVGVVLLKKEDGTPTVGSTLVEGQKKAERPKKTKASAKSDERVEAVEKPTKAKVSAKADEKAEAVEKPKRTRGSAKSDEKVETVVEKPKKAKVSARSHENIAAVELPAKKEKSSAKSNKPVSTAKTSADTVATSVDEDASELTPDQTAALLAGFSSDDDEASDNEGIEISKLPAAPIPRVKALATTSSGSDPESTPGVIYISRVPHGFFEKQMRAYFSQFGDITNLRLARNRKTRKSQHYGFIEFASAAVADIVAKTMDKYLLFGHLLQVKRVPSEQVKEGIWKGPRGSHAMPRNRIEGTKLKQGLVRDQWEKKIEREEERRKTRQEKLKEMDYEFDLPELKKVSAVPVKDKALPELTGGEEEQVEKTDDEVAKLIAFGEATQHEAAQLEQAAPVEVVKEKKVKRKSADGATSVKKTKKVKVTS